MVRNNESKAASSCCPVCRDYVSPEVVVVLLESAGILCSSVEGVGHDGFSTDNGDEFDL